MKIHYTILGCSDCKMSGAGEDLTECKLTNTATFGRDGFPSNCPLLEEDVVITMGKVEVNGVSIVGNKMNNQN